MRGYGAVQSVRGSRSESERIAPRRKRKPRTKRGFPVLLDEARAPYIMPSIPPMPPGGIAGPLSFFGFSATVASVVISNPAIDAAF